MAEIKGVIHIFFAKLPKKISHLFNFLHFNLIVLTLAQQANFLKFEGILSNFELNLEEVYSKNVACLA